MLSHRLMASDGADFAASADWFDEPMRWLQLNFVPDDVMHADIAAWQRYWRDARVDGLTLSAAGATAFYPTAVPFHHRSEYLGERDFFGELVAAAEGARCPRVGALRAERDECGARRPRTPTGFVQRAQATSDAPVDRTLQGRAARLHGRASDAVLEQPLLLVVRAGGHDRARDALSRSTASTRTGGRKSARRRSCPAPPARARTAAKVGMRAGTTSIRRRSTPTTRGGSTS